MTQAKTLAIDTLSHLQEALRLEELRRPDGGPYVQLQAAHGGAPVGELRVYSGGPVSKLVYVGLTVAQLGLDSHMLFAFTQPTSAVPHFTLDSVFAGEHFAFHCDLVPRVDLGADLPYLDAAFHPLTERFLATQKIAGLSPAQLTPRQTALLSQWMLAYRADAAAFSAIAPVVREYADHWLGLCARGLDGHGTGEARAERDRKNRAALFNPDVDPVWARVDRLVGAETGERMRAILRSQSLDRAGHEGTWR
jgi:hypothetical protein